MTGAPVPAGADGVVRIEHTEREAGPGGERVRVLSEEDAGRNLRPRGQDVQRGAVVLHAGMVLRPAALGLAAAVGRARLRVVRRPLVGVLSSGDELVEVDDFEEVLAGRRIVSSNGHVLAAQLAEMGAEVRPLGIARDDPASLREHLRRAEGCDALVTSAGVSVGEHDHLRSTLRDFGLRLAFWRVRMRPGSPFAFGHLDGLGGIPWFGLPGNPVSAMVTFEVLARPALLRMAGHREVAAPTLPVRLLDDYPQKPGLTHFPRVILHQGPETTASLTGPQGSGLLSSGAAADALLVVPEDRPGAAAGEVLPAIRIGRG
jgi:molybdopterin molybdotransferase